MAVFWYVLVAYLSIFIHELGHYTSAYLFGIKATDVITGMGFKFFTFKTKSTTFRFNIIPGGGVTIYPQNQELTLSRLKQFIVLGSGVTFNYIAAVCATTLYLKTSPIAGFLAFNQMIINFIKTLFTLFSIDHFLAPHVGMAESIGMIANQFTTGQFVLFIFIFMNLLLFLFNLLPIPYFDGGQMISLYTDPILQRIGLSEAVLEQIKILINQLIGILLLIAACLPLINEAYHRIIKTYLTEHDMIKWALIVVGFLLIKRLVSPLISSHKKKKRV